MNGWIKPTVTIWAACAAISAVMLWWLRHLEPADTDVDGWAVDELRPMSGHSFRVHQGNLMTVVVWEHNGEWWVTATHPTKGFGSHTDGPYQTWGDAVPHAHAHVHELRMMDRAWGLRDMVGAPGALPWVEDTPV
jgi:hypothetical protein